MDRRNYQFASVIVLLLVCLLGYVGSYLLLVNYEGEIEFVGSVTPEGVADGDAMVLRHFHYGGAFAEAMYCPLLKIDQRLRPDKWWTVYPAQPLPSNGNVTP